GSPVKLLSVASEHAEAARLAAEGAAFLRRHGLEVEEWPVEGGHPTELLLAEAATSAARLMVMGAFGTSGLWAMLRGSPTLTLLRQAPCALFVHH
ncbi:MAG: universal stress protein, partial [Acetobacteraceae bacterium]|nr:universal stress protein [Acetobacteraceae bacterium]